MRRLRYMSWCWVNDSKYMDTQSESGKYLAWYPPERIENTFPAVGCFYERVTECDLISRAANWVTVIK